MREKSFTNLHKLLEEESKRRDSKEELSLKRPDPLMVAREQSDQRAVLLCALFAYGNAKQIVKFLLSLDFNLLNRDEDTIRSALFDRYYRFQSPLDTQEIFITLSRIEPNGLERVFMRGFEKKRDILDGVFSIIKHFESINPYMSRGYRFLIGSTRYKPSSPYKRWMMFLRWMVRKDNLDFGIWNRIKPSELVVPLDTHTFKIGQKLGLIERKSYDWKAALELTNSLKKFCKDDPLKYDFALYRIGQESLLKESF